jgi:alkanesulfonate monooxygenase SsuD/methylene tetrahydromethanopterin reductase-like flavin-dependent oxidoreductase (luciferase family)
MILGVGAGWQEREHQLFGFELGDIATRMARFAEGLEVVTRLLKSDEAVTYEGRFYQLRGATLLPRPQRKGGPRILIGGNGPKRTLPLVARYADIWNGTFLAPEEFRERSTILDKLLSEAGRKPGDVRRTEMRGLYFGRDMKELDRRLRWRTDNPDYAGKSLQEVIDSMAQRDHEIVGTTDMVIEQIKTYEAAGVEELMLQWFDVDDLDGLRTFAKSVLPNV